MNESNLYSSPIPKSGAGDMFDYSHANKLFVGENFRLAPKYSFLYFVRFETDATLTRITDSKNLLETGMMVKAVNLPKYTIDNKVLNSYNRPSIIQTKIKYDPVTLTFHDDNFGVVIDFWRDYYTYYYRDSDYAGTDDADPALYHEDYKYVFNPQLKQKTWGYTLRNFNQKKQLLRNIRIYSMSQGVFTEYMLVNPTITSFAHGQHDASATTETMQHEMTVSYESVLYFNGYIKTSTVPGFAELHYDTRPSPLTPRSAKYDGQSATGALINSNPGTTGPGGLQRPRAFGARSVFGNGGIVSTSDQIIGDIRGGNFRGAIQKGYTSFHNLKGADLSLLARAETREALIQGIMTGKNPFAGLNIPNIGNLGTKVGGAVTQGVDWARNKFNIGKKNQGVQSNGGNSNQSSIKPESIAFGRTEPPRYDNNPGSTGVVSNGQSVNNNSSGYGYVPRISYNGLPLDNVADLNTAPGSVRTTQTIPYSVQPINYPSVTATNQGTTNGVAAFKQNPRVR
jgi:hypothetical protein